MAAADWRLLLMFVRRHLLLKSMGESMLNIRKIQCGMRFGGIREEASAVKKFGRKYYVSQRMLGSFALAGFIEKRSNRLDNSRILKNCP